MNVFFKNFIISICIVCPFIMSTRYQSTYALVGLDDAIIIGGITVTSGMIATLVGVTLVAGGSAIVANTDSTDITYIAQGLIATGNASKDLSISIDNTGKQFLSWTADGFSWFSDTISSMVSSGLTSYSAPTGVQSYTLTGSGVSSSSPIWCIPSVTIPAGSIISGSLLKGSVIVSAWSYTNKSVDSVVFRTGIWQTLGYTYRGYFLNGILIATYSLSQSFNSSNYTLPVGSICVEPVGSGVISYDDDISQDVIGGDAMSADGSVSYQPKVGVPLVTDSTGVTTGNISIPYGKAWSDVANDTSIVKDTDIDTTGDTTVDDTGTGTLNIPILGDILKILQKILSFLLSFISSLVSAFMVALSDLFTKLFVPSSTFFTDAFTRFQTGISGKLGIDLTAFNSILNSSSTDPLKDITFVIFGQTCTISLSMTEKIVPVVRSLSVGVTFLGLAFLNYRKIIWLIRGSSPTTPMGGTGDINGIVPRGVK